MIRQPQVDACFSGLYLVLMNTLAKSEPLDTLGLPAGDHWVKFHVEGDTIAFEVRTSIPQAPAAGGITAAQSFVEKWSGKGRMLSEAEMGDDARLAALTARHLH